MKTCLLPLLLYLSCSTSNETRKPDTGTSLYDDGLRQPTELSTAPEPVQPAAPPTETPAPAAAPPASPKKEDPCVSLCAAYRKNDAECDRLSELCNQMFAQQNHLNGATCKKQAEVCGRLADTAANLGKCKCN